MNIFQANQELHALVLHYKAEQDRQSVEIIEENVSCFPEQVTNLKRPEVYKPFFIIFFFCLLQILSGSYIVIFYSVSLISSASGGEDMDVHSRTVAVMTAFVRFVVSIITTISLIRLGRRKIGLISGVGTALACFLLVGFLELKKYGWIELDSRVDVTIISSLIMVYVALNTFGIFGLPCLMIGEVLPARVRGIVTGILLTLINLVNFGTTKLYPSVAHVLGPSGVFLGFALAATTATVYIYLFLPETKNHPLTRIEQYFAEGKNFFWATRDKTLLPRNKTKSKQTV